MSTAIRTVRNPAHWVLVDNINSQHMLKKDDPGIGGKAALKDPSVEIVIPTMRLSTFKDASNVTVCRRVDPKDRAARRRKPKQQKREPVARRKVLRQNLQPLDAVRHRVAHEVRWV